MTKRIDFYEKRPEVCEAYRFRYKGTKRMGFYLLPTLPFSEDAQKKYLVL